MITRVKNYRAWYLVVLILVLNGLGYLGIAQANNHASQATIKATAVSIARNNLKWCHALDLITTNKVPKPVDPAHNPARVFAYKSYVTFSTLKEEFGCND